MTFSFLSVLFIACAYLLLLFVVAWLADSGIIPVKIRRHPLIYTLSMGVYASAWAIYGSLAYAQQYGYGFLSYYLGISGVFFLAPLLLTPLLRLTSTHQLSSLADVFSFRYRSPLAGSTTALLMLASMLPLLALQIQAVAQSLRLLTLESDPEKLAFWFCALITLFAILFGARHVSLREKHEGLVIAIAAESLFKLIALGTLAVLGIKQVFGDFSHLQQWLAANPEQVTHLYAPLVDGAWHSMILAFFIAAILMPHTFHMAFTENINPKAIKTASWGVPLLMLLLALCVPLILFAGNAAGVQVEADYYPLAVGALHSPQGAFLAYTAGLAGASGMLIVTTLALSSMLLNHWVLPARSRRLDKRLNIWLLWARRVLIAGILVLAYLFYLAVGEKHSLMELGVLAFIATLQFTPGLLSTLYWQEGNRFGFFAGLFTGFFIWFVALFIPMIWPEVELNNALAWLHPEGTSAIDQWHKVATITVVANTFIFALVSMLTPTSRAEKSAAEACTANSLKRPMRLSLVAKNTVEIQNALAAALGEETARREVELALSILGFHFTEDRPYALRRLRDQLETNLSGLLGPTVAHDIIEKHLPYLPEQGEHTGDDFQFIETRIELYRDRLSGLAAELDSLRRFHRQTLLELPMGVVSLAADGEIIGWNHAMEQLTNIAASDTIGSRLSTLPMPWQALLHDFALGEELRSHQVEVQLNGGTRWFNLHKSTIHNDEGINHLDGQVIVMEDSTEIYSLETRLNHSERLASIGRLAAGVAHEIGNPVTAIACLAQNLQHEESLQEMQQSAEHIITQTQRISRIVDSLVTYSHSGKAQAVMQSPVSLYNTAQEAIELLQLSPNRQQFHFRNLCHPEHLVKGDSQKLLQVFVNLLNNAADASVHGQAITVRTEEKHETIDIIVEDEGQGIPPHLLDVLFEPFVTSKTAGRGTGLGLALVYSIIEDHFGSIRAESPTRNNSGTRFIITLPRFRIPQSELA